MWNQNAELIVERNSGCERLQREKEWGENGD
jgi:hypothetical protein